MGNDMKKSLLLRLPVKTWKSVKKQAKENNRSLTAEIVTILEDNVWRPVGVTADSARANTVTILEQDHSFTG